MKDSKEMELKLVYHIAEEHACGFDGFDVGTR